MEIGSRRKVEGELSGKLGSFLCDGRAGNLQGRLQRTLLPNWVKAVHGFLFLVGNQWGKGYNFSSFYFSIFGGFMTIHLKLVLLSMLTAFSLYRYMQSGDEFTGLTLAVCVVMLVLSIVRISKK